MAGGMIPAAELRAALSAGKKRMKELERELHRKDKALAETAALGDNYLDSRRFRD